MNLSLGLARDNIDVTVLVGTVGGPLAAPLQAANVRIIDLGRNRGGRMIAMLRLIRALWVIRPDILHSFLTLSNVAAVLARPFAPNFNLVWGIRNSEEYYMNYSPWARFSDWLECRLAAYADMILVNSVVGHDYCAKRGFPQKRMAVVHNGIDTGQFRPRPAERATVRAALGIDENAPVIGYVARIVPQKDHQTALSAARIFVSRHPDARFVFVGDDQYNKYGIQNTVRQNADDLGLADTVLWLGVRDDVPHLLAAFDIHTSSSVSEGFSNALAEAMAVGVPNVTTDTGDSALIVSTLGKVVPLRNPEALATAWECLLKKKRREGIALSNACRSHIVENFGVDAMVFRTMNYYSRLINDPNMPAGQD